MNAAKKIYIADDENNIRAAIKTFLDNAGYIVEDFETGDALFEAFVKSPADLVVLDVMMPGSNGFVICKELRKIASVPIIILTARDSDLDYATGLDLGGDDYLIKPFSPMSLVMRIKTIFRRIELDKKDFLERDMLTGVFNNLAGYELIETKLEKADEKYALAFINIIKLKAINQTHGRDAGDKVLISLAQTLTSIFCNESIICRYSGNEFLVLTKAYEDINENLFKIASSDLGFNSKISYGISIYPENGETLKQLINHTQTPKES